jgi:KipI family sensor histidine kinase inhibitor
VIVHPTLAPVGDTAALVRFGEEISLGIMGRTHALVKAIEGARIPGIHAAILGRSSVLVYFDPLVLSFEEVEALVREVLGRGLDVRPVTGRQRDLPTVYGGPYGPDLRHVAEFHGISEDEVVRLQARPTYTVIFLGFAPGLAQLMGLPVHLTMPRKASPEVVPAGSIMVAGQAVAIPVETPSGWWCIGRTPVPLFRPDAEEVTYLSPGDEVRFIPIDETQYERLVRPSPGLSRK